MVCSLRSERKRPTWDIALYLLTLFAGCILVGRAYAEDQEPFMSKNDTASGPVIGIDFGTSYSCAGIMKNGKFEIIVDNKGNRATPSWVAFADEQHLIGEAAKNQVANNSFHTIFDIKRLIGRNFNEESVQNDIRYFPFKVINGGGQPHISVRVQEEETTFTSEEISAMILGAIKNTAENYLGEPVRDAVIAVPAYFNDAQRAAIKDAGTIAGLNILRIVNEPTAAALAYGLDKMDTAERRVLIYDLGSTFDVSVVAIEDGIFEILSTAGDTRLGGEDFNNRVVSYLAKKYNKKNNVDVTKDTKSMRRLKQEIEKAKHNLSLLESTKIEIESFHKGSHFSETITRAQFEALNKDLFKKTLESVNQVLKDAEMKKDDIDDIVLVGGSTRIPKIQQMLEEYFGKKVLKDLNPEESIAMGAASVGSGFTDDFSYDCICGVTPLSLGIETTDGATSRLIKRSTIVPTKKSRIFSTTADSQTLFVIKVVQGERFMGKDNHKLAEFELSNIPSTARGIPQIEVTFEIDFNGILKVSAIDKDSGEGENITIDSYGQLSEKDIERMVEEAEKHAEEDVANRKRFETREKLENYVYNLKNQIYDDKEIGGKYGKDDKQFLFDAIKETQDWLGENAAEARVEDFEEQLQKLSDASNFITSLTSCHGWWCLW